PSRRSARHAGVVPRTPASTRWRSWKRTRRRSPGRARGRAFVGSPRFRVDRQQGFFGKGRAGKSFLSPLRISPRLARGTLAHRDPLFQRLSIGTLRFAGLRLLAGILILSVFSAGDQGRSSSAARAARI